MNIRVLGSQAARAKFSELVELAHHGSPTVILKHGRPYAALVPISKMVASPGRISVLSLSGTGVGLWGDRSSRSIACVRDEWE